MLTQLPNVPVKHDIIVCNGGMNTQTPPLLAKPGTLTYAMNFWAQAHGGYRRIPGYERFDGHPSPTDLSENVVVAIIDRPVYVPLGAEIFGKTSGAAGILVGIESKQYAIAMHTGGFVEGERLFNKKSSVGTLLTFDVVSSKTWCHYRQMAADHWRKQISPVPGVGPIRGVWEYNGIIYAFRDDAEAASCMMYRATKEGWARVSTPNLSPGGHYEFVNNNFANKFCMYGASGTHRAFQFDGETFQFITTGMDDDKPSHIEVHKNHLFLSFGSSVQHSPIGDPTAEWSVVLGAGEIMLNDAVTGFVSLAGNQETSSLLITTRNRTFILYGSSSADWTLVTGSHDTGALSGTLQKIGDVLMLDDRGVSTLTSSTTFGNFAGATLSEHIQNWIFERKKDVRASCVSRENNQYRLFFGNKEALYLTFLGKKNAQFMPMRFRHEISCVCSCELGDGTEAIFFGSDDGTVYQLDKGSSFDGKDIESFLFFAFNHSGSPRINKRYRKLVFELTGQEYCEFKATIRLGHDSPRLAQPSFSDVTNDTNISAWDASLWDVFFWDGRNLVPSEMSVVGSAENFSVYVFGKTTDFLPFAINSIIASYTPRRRLR